MRAFLRCWIYRDFPIPARWEVTTLTYDLERKEVMITVVKPHPSTMTHLSGSTAEATPLGPAVDSGHLLKCCIKYLAKLASDGRVKYGRR